MKWPKNWNFLFALERQYKRCLFCSGGEQQGDCEESRAERRVPQWHRVQHHVQHWRAAAACETCWSGGEGEALIGANYQLTMIGANYQLTQHLLPVRKPCRFVFGFLRHIAPKLRQQIDFISSARSFYLLCRPLLDRELIFLMVRQTCSLGETFRDVFPCCYARSARSFSLRKSECFCFPCRATCTSGRRN